MKTNKLFGIIALIAVIGFFMAGCPTEEDDSGGGEEEKYTFTYNIGDTGPGGGKIFYRSAAGFKMTDTNEVCHYLEAAPAGLGALTWNTASENQIQSDIQGTGEAIGTGRKNTALILATDKNAPAAKACDTYEYNGKTDWFLPSTEEALQLYANRTALGITGITSIWTSTQHVKLHFIAYLLNFNTGKKADEHKYLAKSVWAVRAVGAGDTALTGTVSITGTAAVGQTLTAVTTALGGSGAITYQWKRGTTVIGTNSSAYVVQAADVGSTITVTVTRAGYTGSKTSVPTATVTSAGGGGPVNNEMIFVPGGSFQMGAANSERNDERPVHTVTLSPFFISKYEVTQAQWQAVMGSLPSELTSGSYGKGDNYPMYYVSWYDALVFCNKLSAAEELTPAYSISGSTDPDVWGPVPGGTVEIMNDSTGYRLPTEAQWEYAARGGNGSPGNYTYAGSNTLSNVAWYSSNSNYTTHVVGTKSSNGLGIYDMTGNVLEWCWDRYGTYPSQPQTDPMGAASESHRIERGGGFSSDAEESRSAMRGLGEPYGKYLSVGIRLARPSSLHLSGDITISPNSNVFINTRLDATYSGTENVTYQWYKDGTILSNAASSAYTPTTAGSYTVTLSAAGYNNKTSDPVVVSVPVLSGITAVYAQGGTTVYPNTPLDDLKQNVTVTALYNDDTSKPVTGYYALSGALTVGESEVTVTYQGQTTTFTVNVTALTVTGIEVTGLPYKTRYGIGDTLDITGIVVTATYNNGSTGAVTVTADDVTGFDSATEGEKTLTVTYEGKTGTFTVSVVTVTVFTVTNATEWNTAITTIRNGGANLNYRIIVNGDVGIPGKDANLNVNKLVNTTITLQGNGRLYLTSDGTMLAIDSNGADSNLIIDSEELILEGRDNNDVWLVIVGNAKLELRNGTIRNNRSGGVLNGGTFIMSGGILTGNGVYVRNDGTFIMSGGKITGNTGRGVTVEGGRFTMNGGEISNNTITGTRAGTSGSPIFLSGGGVSVANRTVSNITYTGTFTMNGGKITGNTISSSYARSYPEGGGVNVAINATFTMNGGEISGNKASSTANPTVQASGGGVNVSGHFTMNGGVISGNSVHSHSVYDAIGAGVCVDSTGHFTMNGGKITGNGGTGVHLGQEFTMYGGEISGNTSTGVAGADSRNSFFFRIVNGTIYGSNEGALSNGGALSSQVTGSQRGTFNGTTWVSKGTLSSTNDTIWVVNGELVQ